MLNEIDILQDVAARLEKAGIAYMLTGSLAMNLYAKPRMTRDIDLVIELSEHQAEIMSGIFSSDYLAEASAIQNAIQHRGMFNLIHLDCIIKVDCILRKSTPYRETEFSRRHSVVIAGAPIWVVSKEDLIISKLAWFKDSDSDRQLDDIRNLVETGYDADYLEKWIELLGLGSTWGKTQ